MKKPLTVPTAVKVPSGVVSEMLMSQVTSPFGFPLAAVKVFPQNTFDKIMLGGIEAEVWLEPGQPATQGRIYGKRCGTSQNLGPAARLQALIEQGNNRWA